MQEKKIVVVISLTIQLFKKIYFTYLYIKGLHIYLRYIFLLKCRIPNTYALIDFFYAGKSPSKTMIYLLIFLFHSTFIIIAIHIFMTANEIDRSIK